MEGCLSLPNSYSDCTLDLDLDESGEVEESDVYMVKQIVLASLDCFGYYFLAIILKNFLYFLL